MPSSPTTRSVGSDFDKARRYAARAGDRALALLAYEEAARLYETALEALDLSGPSEEGARCELLLSLGEAEARAGDSPAAKKAFLDAAEIAQRLGLARELARAAAGYGGRIMFARAGRRRPARAAARGGAGRARRRRASSYGPGFSPASRERFATNTRAIAATH